MTAWQDIETAPKDGTPILLAGGEDDNAFYGATPAQTSAMKTPCRAWWDGDGWLMTLAEAGCVGVIRLNPTHWMPLPPPPNHRSQSI